MVVRLSRAGPSPLLAAIFSRVVQYSSKVSVDSRDMIHTASSWPYGSPIGVYSPMFTYSTSKKYIEIKKKNTRTFQTMNACGSTTVGCRIGLPVNTPQVTALGDFLSAFV